LVLRYFYCVIQSVNKIKSFIGAIKMSWIKLPPLPNLPPLPLPPLPMPQLPPAPRLPTLDEIIETGKDAVEEAGKAVEGAAHSLGDVIFDVGAVATGSIGDALEEPVKVFSRNMSDLAANISREAETGADAVTELGEVSGSFLEKQIELTLRQAPELLKLAVAAGPEAAMNPSAFFEEKIANRFLSIAQNYVERSYENTAGVIEESSLARSLVAVYAASFGPAGSCAFSAWYTYRTTGNFDQALKAGLIAYLSADSNNKISNETLVKGLETEASKVFASAAVGAVALAASGGSERDVAEGFLRGAALGGARSYYKEMTKEKLDGRLPKKAAIDKKSVAASKEFGYLRDEDGKILTYDGPSPQVPKVAIVNMGKDVNHVGLASGINDSGVVFEGSPISEALSQVPYVNDMAYFHDIVCDTFKLEGLEVQASILPAIGMVYAGTDAPLVEKLIEEAKEEKAN
jgi:hypothetical protein